MSLAVDPLSQELVHYRVQTVPSPLGSATLPAAVNWTEGSLENDVYGESAGPSIFYRMQV